MDKQWFRPKAALDGFNVFFHPALPYASEDFCGAWLFTELQRRGNLRKELQRRHPAYNLRLKTARQPVLETMPASRSACARHQYARCSWRCRSHGDARSSNEPTHVPYAPPVSARCNHQLPSPAARR